jgi:SAM-dependent methyltransferase
MVVQHKKIPFVSYPNEWCVDMFKDAALLMLDLEIELTRRGLTLKDGHPWNILFDECKPVYVDLTSIQPSRDEAVWPAYDEYCRFCYYPLILMCHGQERIARCLVSEYEGVQRADLSILRHKLAFTPFLLTKILRRALRPLRSSFRRQSLRSTDRLSFLTRLREDLRKLKPPRNHHDLSDLSPREDRAANERALREVLDELRPASVLDVNSGEGSYAIEAARFVDKVVSFDRNPARVTRIYREARKANLPILPLIMDFVKPTPSAGYSSHYAMAATERLKCDLVLAFSLVKELVFERYFNFELIAEGLSSFSNRWLLVEFISREDREISAKWGDRFSWYTLDNFIAALRDHFSRVNILPGAAEGRVLLLCEKNR